MSNTKSSNQTAVPEAKGALVDTLWSFTPFGKSIVIFCWEDALMIRYSRRFNTFSNPVCTSTLSMLC